MQCLGVMLSKPKRPGRDAKYYLGRVDTRWHVYPQRQRLEAVAHDWYGYWALTAAGEWYMSPVAFNFERQVTEAEALAFVPVTP